ncbi:MAG: Rpn family recombination-promoting nuclease/putative transposase [Bacteroidia bacterium]|nr:Rpn family recombination-promoting nuclease/putative transposase [Bacteroidia bacterium]
MMKNLIRFDWALKRLLRNKANYKVLDGFMSELLNEDITIINILESEGNQETEDDKFNRVDLLVENSKKELTIIEIQQRNEFDYFHRILYGTSKLIAEYLKLGEPYSNIRKVYSVNILYFDLGQGEDYIYHGKTDFEGIHKHDKLLLSEKQIEKFHKFKPEQIFPEYFIIKVNRFDDFAKSTLDEWIYYLKNDEIKDEFKAKGLLEAKEILKVDKLSEDDRRAYKRYWENKSYEASIVDTIKTEQEYYKKEVKKELYFEIAKKCLQKGMNIMDIIELTGLSKEEIEKSE